MKFLQFTLLILITLINLASSQDRQIYDATRSTNLRFRYDFSKASTQIVVVLTTSEPRASTTGFFFNPTNQPQIPRIISVVKVNPINSTNGIGIVPRMDLPVPVANITANYFKVTVDSKNIFVVTGSETDNTADFPTTNQTFETVFVPTTYLPDVTDYQTLIYNTLIQHNSNVALTCQYTVDYIGLIRSIFFNDDREGQWGLQTDTFQSQSSTSGSVKLKAGEMILVTIVGYRLNVVGLKILNCQNDQGVPALVNITFYRPGGRVVAPEVITFLNQTSSCEPSSTRCSNINTSLKCAAGFFRVDNHCRQMCPLSKPTVTSLGDCRDVGYNLIRRGFKTTPEQPDSGNTIFEYYVDLPAASQVLTIFWPSEDLIMTATPIWFAKGSYLLPKVVFTKDILPVGGVLSYSVKLNLLYNDQLPANTARNIIYTHHSVIDDPQKAIIVVTYPQEPLNENDMKNPLSFAYLPSGQPITLNPSTYTYVTTFLECKQACSLTIQSDGKVEGYQDPRTFFLELDFSLLDSPQYTVPFSFSGVTWLTFKVKDSSNFQLQVTSGDYKIFSYDFPLTLQSLSLMDNNQNNIVPATCYNGENNLCYSCIKGYFMNTETQQCEFTCPVCYVSSPSERKCLKAECPKPPEPEKNVTTDVPNTSTSGNTGNTNVPTGDNTGSTGNEGSTNVPPGSDNTTSNNNGGSTSTPGDTTGTTNTTGNGDNKNTPGDTPNNTNPTDNGGSTSTPGDTTGTTGTTGTTDNGGSASTPGDTTGSTGTTDNGDNKNIPDDTPDNGTNDNGDSTSIPGDTPDNTKTTDNGSSTDIPQDDEGSYELSIYKDAISTVSQYVPCPPGSIFDVQSKRCKGAPTLSIMGSDQISFCADLILTASMNPVEELYLTPIKYTWSVEMTSSITNLRLLQDYLKTQTLKDIIVPARFLAIGARYTFTVQYINALKETVSSTFSTLVTSDGVPQVNIDGGARQALYHYEDNILKARVAYSQSCFGLTEPLKAEWTQISGPTLDLSSESVAMPSSFWLGLPKCGLVPGNSYEFEVRVWRADFPENVSTARTKFQVPPVNFTIQIEGGNRQASASSDITLSSKLNYRTKDCPIVQDNIEITYEWTCQKKLTQTPDKIYTVCPDPSGLFNSMRKDSALTIPVSYFNEGETLRIGVTAKKNGDSTFSFINVDIIEPTSLSVSIGPTNYKLGIDPQELLFAANVAGNRDGVPVNYVWNVYPSMRAISFKNQFKVMNYYQILDNQMMNIQLQAQVDGLNTFKSTLQIPRNPAPRGGSLSVTPSSGYSLSTYFYIVAAGWKDDDAPLSYEFFYSFEDGQEFRLTDVQKSQDVYTLLPGNCTNSMVTIKVVIRDSLGATNTAKTIVEVISTQTDLSTALTRIKQNYTEITRQGNPIILEAEPFEMFKTLTFLGQELASYENLEASYSGESLTLKTKNQILNFKMALTNNIQGVHSLLSHPDTDEILIQTVSTLTYNTVFNFPASLLMTVRAMSQNLKTKTVLSKADISNTADIITNVLANFKAGTYETSEARELRDFTDSWLNKISTNALDGKLPGEIPIMLESRNFDAYIARVTGCSIVNIPIRTSLNSPTLEFEILKDYENSPSFSCDKIYNVIYFAFNQNASSDQNVSSLVDAQKSMIVLNITDVDKKVSSLPLNYVLTETNYCPSSCFVRETGACVCSSISTFDQENVLDILFDLTEKDSNGWQLLPLQITLASTTWLILTILIVKYLIPKYCQMTNFVSSPHKTSFKALMTALWISPKLLDIYTYNNKDLPKIRRALLYFLRVQMFSLLGCALASKATKQRVDQILAAKYHSSIPYYLMVFLLPYITIVPLHAILEILLRNYKSPRVAAVVTDNPEGYEAVPNRKAKSESSLPQNSKCLFGLGVLVSLIVLAGIEGYTWAFGTKKTISTQEKSAWLSYLVLGLVLDLAVTPLVLNGANYIALRLWATKSIQKNKYMKKLLESVIAHKIMKLKKELSSDKKVIKLDQKNSNTEGIMLENNQAHDRQIPVGNPLPNDVNVEVLDYRNIKK